MTRISRAFIVSASSAIVCTHVVMATALAHAPHDAVSMVRLSPSFDHDQTVILSVNLTDHKFVSRSTDGGRRWSHYGPPVTDKNIIDLAIPPDFTNDSTVFAGTRVGGVYRSLDGGIEWDPINVGLPPGDSIAWYALMDSESGMAEVSTDGKADATVDLYAPVETPLQEVYKKTFPTIDWHTIEVKVLGQSGVPSTGVYVKSDGFRYTF